MKAKKKQLLTFLEDNVNIRFLVAAFFLFLIVLKGFSYMQLSPFMVYGNKALIAGTRTSYNATKNYTMKKLMPSDIVVISKPNETPLSNSISNFSNGTTCSRQASALGNHQKIVSYSIFGTNEEYWKGLNETLNTVRHIYPGWYVRIYTTYSLIPVLEPLQQTHSHLHLCNVKHLPEPLTDISSHPPMTWRFAPMGDSQVDVVIFRDSDSQIIQREADAVHEWLNATNKPLHVMRDHWAHKTFILGGMWGLRITSKNRRKIKKLRDTMYRMALLPINILGFDQYLLQRVVWRALKHDAISHDSYLCQQYSRTSPWPTQRQNHLFVGAAYYRSHKNGLATKECPQICRPKDHQDWKYC